MTSQKPVNTANKVDVGLTLDQEVVKAISERKGRLVKKSTYVNHILREYFGLEEAEA